jgi:hypothetical protein
MNRHILALRLRARYLRARGALVRRWPLVRRARLERAIVESRWATARAASAEEENRRLRDELAPHLRRLMKTGIEPEYRSGIYRVSVAFSATMIDYGRMDRRALNDMASMIGAEIAHEITRSKFVVPHDAPTFRAATYTPAPGFEHGLRIMEPKDDAGA